MVKTWQGVYSKLISEHGPRSPPSPNEHLPAIFVICMNSLWTWCPLRITCSHASSVLLIMITTETARDGRRRRKKKIHIRVRIYNKFVCIRYSAACKQAMSFSLGLSPVNTLGWKEEKKAQTLVWRFFTCWNCWENRCSTRGINPHETFVGKIINFKGVTHALLNFSTLPLIFIPPPAYSVTTAVVRF